MASGAFATSNVNFNIADDDPEREIFPYARQQNMRVVVREAYIKGVLFRLGREAGINDDVLLARAAMKWLGGRPGVDTVIIGADNKEQFVANVGAFENPALDGAETAVLEKLKAHPSFVALRKQKLEEFSGGIPRSDSARRSSFILNALHNFTGVNCRRDDARIVLRKLPARLRPLTVMSRRADASSRKMNNRAKRRGHQGGYDADFSEGIIAFACRRG